MTNPLDAEDLRTRVQQALDDHLSLQAARLNDISADLAPLMSHITDLVRGGKRLRPAFCYWGWRGAGASDGDSIVAAAACLELFHAAALLHDDVMDASDTRRGRPTTHRRMATLHRASGWAGDAERFGTAAAILAGDLCLSWSDEMFSRCGLPEEALDRGREVFERMRTDLMAGQFLDVLEQALPETAGADGAERASKVIRFKSAKYTIEHPMLIGGALAGAAPDLLASYSAYGLALGEAFQLRDDVLGVFGDPQQTGKPAGDDLREGKRTVLIALALQGASAQQAALVRRHLGDPDLDPEGVAALREVIVATGALPAVEQLVNDLVAQARAALAASAVAEPARSVLAGLVHAATERLA